MGNFINKIKKHRFSTRTVAKTQIMDLPEEVWLLIFRHLDTPDLYTRVKLVCQDWCRVIEDSSLYGSVLIDYRLPEESIPIVHKYRESIFRVDIKHHAQIQLLLEEYLLKCDKLTTLRIWYCDKCKDVNMTKIKQLFKCCTRLSKLEIKYELSYNKGAINLFFLRYQSHNDFVITARSKKKKQKSRKEATTNVTSTVVNLEHKKLSAIMYKLNVKEFIGLAAQEMLGIKYL